LRFEIFQNENNFTYRMFRDRYISMFERLNPQIEIEYVSQTPHDLRIKNYNSSPTDDRLEQLKQWIEATNADVLMLHYADFELLLQSDETVFAPLDPWIAQSDWDISDLTPAAVEAFRHP